MKRMANNYEKILGIAKKPKYWIGFVIFSTVIICWNLDLGNLNSWKYLKSNEDEMIRSLDRPYNSSKMKYILYWNSFYGVPDMYYGTGSGIFKSCPSNNCFATTNKTLLPVEDFDSIIFHGPRYSSSGHGVPRKRRVHQKYIFYSLESPFNSDFDNMALVNFYNWTMTYRRDSDIYTPYALVEKKETNYITPDEEAIKSKTKLVGWFVSHCKNDSSKKRMAYAKDLQNYIPIDIYGACGKYKCDNRTACYQMLDNDYKFYLSFENSLCKDYITEKMFTILKYNVIPVVFGYSDYKTLAPPHSVIDTKDFSSPRELARYLLYLHNNPKEYLKYFEWKKYYIISSRRGFTLCQICKLLHQPLTYSSYGNIKDWFYGFDCIN